MRLQIYTINGIERLNDELTETVKMRVIFFNEGANEIAVPVTKKNDAEMGALIPGFKTLRKIAIQLNERVIPFLD